MPKVVITAAMLATLLLAPALHANDAENEALCRKWAQEDEVAQEYIATYLADCAEDLRRTASEESGQASSGDDR